MKRPPDISEHSKPTVTGIFADFLRLGLTAFGGPAMVGHIRDLAVGKRGWVTEESFREGVALCQSLPGATAMQTAAYAGLRAGGGRVSWPSSLSLPFGSGSTFYGRSWRGRPSRWFSSERPPKKIVYFKV